LDSGPSDLQGQEVGAAFQDEEDVVGGDAPAWSDSDDERISVSLAMRPQLRKLRRTEGDEDQEAELGYEAAAPIVRDRGPHIWNEL